MESALSIAHYQAMMMSFHGQRHGFVWKQKSFSMWILYKYPPTPLSMNFNMLCKGKPLAVWTPIINNKP